MIKFILIAGILLRSAVSLSTQRFAIIESRSTIPDGWELYKKPNGSDQLTLSIALKQPGLATLKNRLLQMSQPGSAEFGKHLSKDEIQVYRQPDQASVVTVFSWLESNNITDAQLQDAWIRFNATVDQVDSMLHADLGYYTFEYREPLLRTQEYSVPTSIAKHIDFIFPLNHFMPFVTSRMQPQEPVRMSNLASPAADLPCSSGVNPACLKSLYNITASPSEGSSPVRLGVAGFLEQFVNHADVSTFLNRYAPDIAQTPYNYTVELLNNGTNPQDPLSSAGIEASLDIQYAMALGYPTSVIYYGTGGRGSKIDANGNPYPLERSDNEPYLEFLNGILALSDDKIPHVLSISYADDEDSVPQPYATRVCDLFLQLAARGVSVLVASGDGGARGTGQTQCFSKDERHQKQLTPTFPPSCPYVTAVGATDNVGPPVKAAALSAGGFSNYFAMPSWQAEPAAKYVAALEDGGDKKGYFNASGRAIPDISAVGQGFAIQWGGRASTVAGTSASTPVFAAMVALVNDARLKAGKGPVGWLNPILYSDKMRAALFDVTNGQGSGCYFGEDGSVSGWPATEGYDCVTGLGTVGSFHEFLEAFE